MNSSVCCQHKLSHVEYAIVKTTHVTVNLIEKRARQKQQLHCASRKARGLAVEKEIKKADEWLTVPLIYFFRNVTKRTKNESK